MCYNINADWHFHDTHYYWDNEACVMFGSKQTKEVLEDWYKTPDPWGYYENPDDAARRSEILNALKGYSFDRALDVGAGEGFITQALPAKKLYAYEISDEAGSRLPKAISRVTEPLPCDLVIATGVFYDQYDWEALHKFVLESATHTILTSHIQSWEKPLPLTPKMELEFPYREYTQSLKVYEITA